MVVVGSSRSSGVKLTAVAIAAQLVVAVVVGRSNKQSKQLQWEQEGVVVVW